MQRDTALPKFDYEEDFVLWIDQQAELLRARRFELLDLDNLLEEIEAMGRSERRELKNRIAVLLLHLLKCKYQPEKISGNWLRTLNEQCARIANVIAESPSLAKLVQRYADHEYQGASQQAASETGLPASIFPSSNPFTADEILDSHFLPHLA